MRTFDALAGFECLVDLEEVLDLELVELGQVADVLQVLQPRVVRRHAQHLVVAAHLVLHPVHADRATPDQTAGERRLLQQHQCIQRIPVRTQRVLDESVVRGVLRRREQGAVKSDATGLVVHLVLVAPALGDLDRDVKLHDTSVP